MKILYLSCHAILEYDELKIFEELGYDYFSLGSYVNPKKPVDPIRPALKGPRQISRWQDKAPDRSKLTKEFIDDFDVVIVMHMPEWIEQNWEVMKHKPVIWRSIGQSTPATEQRLAKYRAEGLKIVRYSPAEIDINSNIGADTVIRFYKDPDEFLLYNGTSPEVITFAQNMKVRDQFCNYQSFLKIVEGFPAKIYGPSNEASGELSGGFLTYSQMQQKMRDARVYVYTGTQPACYTLSFIEAMLTGIPIVAIGSKLWNSLNVAGDIYEVPQIIRNGYNGFVSDNIDQLRENIQLLLSDQELAKKIGYEGRQTAIKLFGKDKIKGEWREFLEYLTNTVQS